jgi:hypothetical protein
MSHGPLPWTPRPPLLVIHPGPVAKVFIDGCEVAAVPLTHSAALAIAAQLLTAVSVRLPAQTATPTENLPFCQQQATRRADGVRIHQDEEPK